MHQIIYKRVDALARSRINSLLATCESNARKDKSLKEILDKITDEELFEINPLETAVCYYKMSQYLNRDSDIWLSTYIPTFMGEEIGPLVTSRNVYSKRVLKFLDEHIFIIKNLPFMMAFKALVDIKRHKTAFHLITVAEQKTEKGSLYLVKDSNSEMFFMLTSHCYERLRERAGMGRHQTSEAKELFILSLFSKPRVGISVDNLETYLIFEDFMCLGSMLAMGAFLFKTIITKDMYTEAQQKVASSVLNSKLRKGDSLTKLLSRNLPPDQNEL